MSVSLRVVLALLAVCLLALAVTGSPVYSRLTYLWSFFLVGNWIWARLSLRGLRVRRLARVRRGQMGQIFEERFEIENDSRLPRLWLEIQDRSPLPGSEGSQVLALIGGREGRSYLARTQLVRRGVFPLGPTRVISGDPFGLFNVQREIDPTETLMIYPYMVDVRVFPNPPGLLMGGEALRRRTPEATANAAGVREYVSGDPFNRIHWLSTVRKDRLMVKEFELDPLSDVWIFLDADREVQSSLPHSESDLSSEGIWQPRKVLKLPPSTEEYGVSVGASLARFFLRQNRSVGLVANGQTYTVLPPDRGARQLNKMLEALALLRAKGRMPFSALVTGQAQHLTRGSTVIMITSSMRQQIALTVDYVARRGLRPVVILLDSGTFGGPLGAREVEMAVRALLVPVARVENGDDLEIALNNVTAGV